MHIIYMIYQEIALKIFIFWGYSGCFNQLATLSKAKVCYGSEAATEGILLKNVLKMSQNSQENT